MSRVLREYVFAQEAHHAAGGAYAAHPDSLTPGFALPDWATLLVVESSAAGHSAVARSNRLPERVCGVWVGVRPEGMDHPRPGEPWCAGQDVATWAPALPPVEAAPPSEGQVGRWVRRAGPVAGIIALVYALVAWLPGFVRTYLFARRRWSGASVAAGADYRSIAPQHGAPARPASTVASHDVAQAAGDKPSRTLRWLPKAAVLAGAVAAGYYWLVPSPEHRLSGLLREYVVVQEIHRTDRGEYADDVAATDLVVPAGAILRVVAASTGGHSAVAWMAGSGAEPVCAVWVGEPPPQLDHEGEGEPLCDEANRFSAWLSGGTRDAPVASAPEPAAAFREPRTLAVDRSACASNEIDPSGLSTTLASTAPRLAGGRAHVTVDRPLPFTTFKRPTTPFRAFHVALDPDTVWFTESDACPTEAVAFVRATGEWVSAVRHRCARVTNETSAQVRSGSVPDPDAGSPPRTLEGTAYIDATFQDSVSLAEGLWLELRVTQVSDAQPPEFVEHDFERVAVTANAYYVLHTPGDTVPVPLRVSDDQWRAAASRWDREDPAAFKPRMATTSRSDRDNYAAVKPSARVARWLLAGNSLFIGLTRHLETEWGDAAVYHSVVRAGGVLHVDLATRQVTPVLHPMLADWLPQRMYVAGGALWDVGRYRGYEETADTHVEAIVYTDDEPDVRRIFRWSWEDGRCDGVRAPGAAVAGDSVWVAYPDRLSLLDFGSGTATTLYLRDSTFTLAGGADTTLTMVSASGPTTPTSVEDEQPTNDRGHARWLARQLRVRRVEAFTAAYLALPDTAHRAIRGLSEHLFNRRVDGPHFDVEGALHATLARRSMMPFLDEAWRYVPELATPWYNGVRSALDSLGGDQLAAVLTTALDSAPIDRATHSAVELLKRGDSTGVEWLRRAIRDPRRIADTASLRQWDRRRMDYLVDLAVYLRTAEWMPPIIDLLDTPHWPTASDALVRLTGMADAPSGVGGGAYVSTFWRSWWKDHGPGFRPVTHRVGQDAQRTWRDRQCSWDSLARAERCERVR